VIEKVIMVISARAGVASRLNRQSNSRIIGTLAPN
jgi:hypothetical protein